MINKLFSTFNLEFYLYYNYGWVLILNKKGVVYIDNTFLVCNLNELFTRISNPTLNLSTHEPIH